MKLTAKRKEQISSVLIICLGNILNAFSARVFLLPADLVAGGTTGIGLILQRITGIPLSSLVLAFNIIMLVLAYIFPVSYTHLFASIPTDLANSSIKSRSQKKWQNISMPYRSA